jgi:PAS domain S-box-containing protein
MTGTLQGSDAAPSSSPRGRGKARAALTALGIAAAYAIGGWFGWLTALPPGYASLIWPGAGIALAAVLLISPRLWPGIFLGSLLINIWVGLHFNDGLSLKSAFVAACVAAGASVQALAVAEWVRRQFGKPITLANGQDFLALVLTVGPAGCCIAATTGSLTLLAAGVIPPESFARNWFIWWSGDILGVCLVFPLAVLSPWWSAHPMKWQGRPITRLNLASLAVVLVSMVLTFYVWTSVTTGNQARGQEVFDQIAGEVVQTFTARMNRYEQSLAAGEGLMLASGQVSREDWQVFTDRIDLAPNLTGVSGIGLIVPVKRADLDAFLAQAAAEGIPDLRPHPDTGARELFVVKLIEPFARNAQALGLDIAFEAKRRNAALAARDSGKTILSEPIRLVQGWDHPPGFILLRPFYSGGTVPQDVDSRRNAFLGWVYAPLSLDNLFAEVGPKHDQQLSLSIRMDSDPGRSTEMILIAPPENAPSAPLFSHQQTLSLFGRAMTFTLKSTPAFEREIATNEGALVLGAGLIITGLIGTLLLTLLSREAAAMRLFRDKARALSAQERMNSSIVDTAVVGTASTDAAGRILRMSRTGAAIFGLPANQTEGMSLAELIGRPLDELLAGSGGAEQDRNRRIPVQTPTLGPRVLDLQISSWLNEENEQRYTWVIADVTSQAETEQRLKQAEQRLNVALVGARIGVFEIDIEKGTSIVSRTWRELMGLDPDGTVDAQAVWRSRVEPADLARVAAADAACLAGETARSVTEYRMQMPDGSLRWMKSDAFVSERDSDGRALRLVGTQTDVTELIEAREALQSSEALLRGMLANAPVGMALVDREGAMLNVNEALCGFLGTRRETLLGAPLGDFTHADDLYLDGEQLRRLLAGEISSYQCEKRYLRGGDTVVWGLLSVSAAGLRGDQGQALIAQIQDISELKAVERMKGDFIASVSHELRTPLTSIKGALGIVLGTMKDSLPAKAEQLLAIAQKNCDRLIQLVNDILDMEKLSSEQTSFSFSNADLAGCLSDVVAVCQPYAQQFDVALVVESEPSLVARVDVNRLSQVVTNLISNAVKYSPRGGTVKISLHREDGSAVISVTDNGEGIPESFRSRLFRPFSQFDMSATRKVGGTGLGLSISRQIVDRMGGIIDFVSVPGVETTFSVTLPLVDEPDSEGPPVQFPSPRVRTRAKLPKVLHVEPDPDFAEVLRAAFARRAQVRVVGNAAEARKALARESFDLVIIDWDLPDGPGESLLPEIQAHPGQQVVGLSARESRAPLAGAPRSYVKSRVAIEDIVADCLSSVAAA